MSCVIPGILLIIKYNMNNKILLFVCGPLGLLEAMSSVQHLYPNSNIDVCFVLPTLAQRETLHLMATSMPSIEHVFTLQMDASLIDNRADEFLISLCKKLGLSSLVSLFERSSMCRWWRRHRQREQYDVVFYPHAVGVNIIKVARLCHHGTPFVCYGDALGIFFEERIHLGLLGIAEQISPLLPPVTADAACGVLPVDQSGYFLEGIPLQIIPKNVFLEVLHNCKKSLKPFISSLESFCNGITVEHKVLLMTEPHVETATMTMDAEIRMIGDMLHAKAPAGSAVIIKPHPGETLPRLAELRKSFGHEYHFYSLPDTLARLPIELFPQLVKFCNTLICLTYPQVTLTFLFDREVYNPCRDNKNFFSKYAFEYAWDSYKNGNELYVECVEALPHWDQNSVLFSGNIRYEDLPCARD